MKKHFQSSVVFSAPSGGIDRESGVIPGITVARIGSAKGHDGEIDAKFLSQIVEQAATRPQGIKARFGHPNMCSTALGTYLGRFHNYCLNGNAVKADLHLDQSAKTSPNGNLFEYVLNMAESNPDMFGASLVFESAEFEIAEIEKEGKKEKHRFFRLKELRATDIVDEPAATDGLFSADSFPALASAFLDQNPELTNLIFSKPESAIEFLSNYLNSNSMKFTDDVISKFKKLFSIQEPEIENTIPAAEPEIFSDQPVDPIEDPEPAEALQSVADPEIPNHENPEVSTPESLEATEDPANPSEVYTSIIAGFYDNLFQNGLTSETPATNPETQLQEILISFQHLVSLLDSSRKEIDQLNARLSAKPSIPLNVSDPQVSTHLIDPVKDETGKQMLSNIPPDLKHKLRTLKPQTPQP